ncbi:MAG: hypothetical protein ISQ32_05195 [Rickettsiales bacterium]|nr:hypothetical protein [Rickettsiales bacterium]
MLDKSFLSEDGPAVILVRTQLAENIGSVARAMGNFGFRDLRLVNPQVDVPNSKATAMACKSSFIIENAKVYNSVEAALQGCDYSYAMSARFRGRVNKEIFTPKEAVNNIKINNEYKSKIAFMFGAENNGLDNTELVFAQKIITIPTSEFHKALNIAQSACVIFYELASAIYLSSNLSNQLRHEKSNIEDVKQMIDLLDEKLEMCNFYKDQERRKAMLLGITNLFVNASLSKSEVKTLNGIFKYLFYYQGNSD